jgi:hypothetical protein
MTSSPSEVPWGSPGQISATVLLCDYAQVWQGKLFVSGAGINLLGASDPNPPYGVGVHVAVIVTVPWTAHNQQHTLKVSLVDPDGQLVPMEGLMLPPGAPESDRGRLIATFTAGRGPHMQAGDESLMPIALPLQARVPSLDSYNVVADIDGSEVGRAVFRVTTMQALSGQG